MAPLLPIRFGDHRARNIAFSLLLVTLTAATVLAWFRWGGRISGSVLLPAALGVALLARTRWGTLERGPREGTVVLRRRSAWWSSRRELDVAAVRGVEIVPASFRDAKPDYVLRLRVGDADESLPLRVARASGPLEADRRAIEEWLRAAGAGAHR